MFYDFSIEQESRAEQMAPFALTFWYCMVCILMIVRT